MHKSLRANLKGILATCVQGTNGVPADITKLADGRLNGLTGMLRPGILYRFTGHNRRWSSCEDVIS